jgi:isoquinoline 1-oxidoreductase beta subunit
MIFDRKSIPDITNVSRRAVLLGLSAGTLVVGSGVGARQWALAEDAPKYGGEGMEHGLRYDPPIFLSVAEDGTVSIVCHRSEMGQGIRTSLTMVAADELGADWAKVRVVQAEADEPKYGNQDTDGSRSMRHHFMIMRRMSAAVRQMLEAAAAASWGVQPADVEAVNHEVVHPASGRKLGFGELAKAASALAVPAVDAVKLKDPSKFRYIGKGQIGLTDNRDITTGKAHYGIDTRLDGMVYAVVERPPVYGGTVANYDGAEALKVPGVLKVVPIESVPLPSEFQPLGGIAVIATNTWAAMKGREKLKITWNDGPNASYTTDTYRKALEETSRKPAKVIRNEGDADAALKSAAKRVSAEYYIPHHAHATMEPPSATVRIVDGKCEAWAPVQAPQATRDRLSKRLGIDVANVTVHVTLLGGGFGRKSKPDFVVEAGLLSKEMGGKPVKVVWTREDDLHHDYYNTTAVEHLEAGLDENGKPVAWLHRSVAPSITSIFKAGVKYEAPFELGLGLSDTPFAVPNLRIENGEADAHTRIGWFRSVTNVPHAFAMHSFVDELAAAAGRDPKDFLLDLIGPPRTFAPKTVTKEPWWDYGENPEIYPVDTARFRGVIEAVAKAANWGRKMPDGSGLGIAAHRSFVTYTAVVAEVSYTKDGVLRIPRVDIAVDCGPQINPERIRSQLEGAVIQGICIATVSNITFKNGRVEQSNFDTFELTRIDAAPREIHVHLVNGEGSFDRPLGGVGEPGVPAVAPAIANAVFAATGKRIRSLPIGSQLAS